MVSCTTAEAGGWLQHGQIGQCLYGECMGMLGSYRGGCLTTDQGTSAGCSLFRVAAGDERWRGRQLDQLEQLDQLSTEEEILCPASCSCWVTWTMGTRALWAQLL